MRITRDDFSIEDQWRFHASWAPQGDCYRWIAAKFANGYAQFSANGHNYRANRVAFALYYGVTEDAAVICHHCDNPLCVKPVHLFAGTHADNTADRVSKGRTCSPSGWARNRILTDEDVLRIRAMWDSGMTRKEIHGRFPQIKHGHSISKIGRRISFYWL